MLLNKISMACLCQLSNTPWVARVLCVSAGSIWSDFSVMQWFEQDPEGDHTIHNKSKAQLRINTNTKTNTRHSTGGRKDKLKEPDNVRGWTQEGSTVSWASTTNHSWTRQPHGNQNHTATTRAPLMLIRNRCTSPAGTLGHLHPRVEKERKIKDEQCWHCRSLT